MPCCLPGLGAMPLGLASDRGLGSAKLGSAGDGLVMLFLPWPRPLRKLDFLFVPLRAPGNQSWGAPRVYGPPRLGGPETLQCWLRRPNELIKNHWFLRRHWGGRSGAAAPLSCFLGHQPAKNLLSFNYKS